MHHISSACGYVIHTCVYLMERLAFILHCLVLPSTESALVYIPHVTIIIYYSHTFMHGLILALSILSVSHIQQMWNHQLT